MALIRFVRMLLLVGALCAASSRTAGAGTITLVPIEPKGILQPGEVNTVFTLKVGVLPFPLLPLPFVLPNLELVFVPDGPPVAWFNIRPFAIEVPQPFDLNLQIDFFWLLAADVGAGIGPVPDGGALEAASLIGLSGTEYPADITIITDLANLPTSSPNNLQISWDLSTLSQTRGKFFLARASLPGTELQVIPEPSAMLLLGGGLVGLAVRRRKMRHHTRA